MTRPRPTRKQERHPRTLGRAKVGARCHLCRHPIANPWEVSEDHLRPESQGGRRVAPAHARCNNARGNLPLNLAYSAIAALGPEGSATPTQVRAALRSALREWLAQGAAEARGTPVAFVMRSDRNQRLRDEKRGIA